MNIAFIVTCHNRKETTRVSLVTLTESIKKSGLENFSFFVTDDGSTDGTADVVKEILPEAIVIRGDGSLFWTGGMVKAWTAALRAGHFDAFFLFNDDVRFYESGVSEMISSYSDLTRWRQSPGVVVAGPVVDSEEGCVSYGGLKYCGLKTGGLSLVQPSGCVREVDTLNMNCALIDSEAVRKCGILDKTFTHSSADLDYGLRLNKSKGIVAVANNSVGVCDRNELEGTWKDPSLNRFFRIKKMLRVKGLPLKERVIFCWRHGGIWFLPCVAWPYLKVLLFNRGFNKDRHVC